MSDKKGSRKEGSGVKIKDKIEVQKPKKYKVVLYNDDYTPMEYVVLLLIQLFHMSQEKATSIMLSIHNSGRGIAGVYSKEIADTKASRCNVLSRELGYPLMAEIEES